ncbi:1-acyl-sn-glycerol-3-phosphate acyltransferase [Rhodobacterales bacterium HKCCE4037]|nr:1-acyl-sn-glycerol-3-phosphate acyltransferase [Rhodobacterales bacterium HKCCE4037]
MTDLASLPRRIAARAVGHALAFVARFITAVRADWRGIEPVARQRVYFANHVSNADMPMIWTVLPSHMRRQTRPVAAADYWLKTRLRAFVGPEVFNCVLIDRRPDARTSDPMEAILAALDEGSSLIIFPEGNRNMTDDPLLPFRAGLYNMGRARPHVDLVPTWVANLNEIMPKGEVIPLPLICTVTFGAPIHVKEGESKDDFLKRAAGALLELAPKPRPDEARPAPAEQPQ